MEAKNRVKIPAKSRMDISFKVGYNSFRQIVFWFIVGDYLIRKILQTKLNSSGFLFCYLSRKQNINCVNIMILHHFHGKAEFIFVISHFSRYQKFMWKLDIQRGSGEKEW